MAKKMMPAWTREALQRFLFPGEEVVAAAPLVNIVSGEGQAMAMLLGSGIGGALETSVGPPRPGYAGMIPAGKVLMAVTTLRILLCVTDKQYRPQQVVAAFGPEHYLTAKYVNSVMTNELTLTFADRTVLNGSIPESRFDSKSLAKRTARAATALRQSAGGYPPA